MNETELIDLLKPYIDANPEGVFLVPFGAFDLDIDLDVPNGLCLWLNGDTSVAIPPGTDPVNVQKAVRSLGRELLHTWGQQYSVNP